MHRLAFILLVAGLFLAGCASTTGGPRNLRTVDRVDLQRYMGDWYVIANIPYSLEKGKVASFDRYALRSDGRLDNTFIFRKGSFDAPEEQWKGVAWIVNRETNAEWKVQFIWPIRSAYRLLDLDPNYQWAVVSSGGGDLVWILARTRQLDDATYASLVEKVRARGLEAAKLAKVPQPAAGTAVRK